MPVRRGGLSACPGEALLLPAPNLPPAALLHPLPVGTHDWSKFLTPEELTMAMEESSEGSLQLEQVGAL